MVGVPTTLPKPRAGRKGFKGKGQKWQSAIGIWQ